MKNTYLLTIVFFSQINFAQSVFPTNGENVGIGTTSPKQKFVVSNNGAEGLEVYLDLSNRNIGLQSYDRQLNDYSKMQLDASQFTFMYGNVSIGTAASNAKLTIQAGPNNYPTPLKAISIIGPNSPANHNSAQDISWDFQHAGSATIRSYRGSSWDTYLQFLTNSYLGGNQPTIRMHISSEGNVGIGTTSPQNKLDVNGTIHSQEVKVDMDNWSDFVFKKEYSLPTLEEVEKHITEKGHLKNIPSEKEVLENGINLGEMNAKLLQKIEEMTLYIIQQNKQILDLNKRLEIVESK